ncbi:MAG: hypothetical protein M0D55_19285 [Elusimicrobiota bacterium]|nr:MAG: hypothetical protein M0D55_19285 [Elusimicrobiota bacterium]
MKKYAAKLKADLKAAGGTTAWDHEACANLVTFFAGGVPGVKRPKEKIVKIVNEALLSPVKSLQDIAAARK